VTQDIRSGPGDLAPGEQVAGYQIQERIGRGGMAVVYRALDLRLGRMVALKVLAPHLGEDEAFRQRFIRESRAAAGVDHPHIIPVFEAGEAGGVLFIAMRYVGYGDVRSLIDAAGSLTPARASTITSQVASALDAAHAHGLVHRDVKPGNMLLGQASGGERDHVYLSDFGLSKYSVTPSTLTSTGQFLGTLDYVSPEQIQGQPVDGRADQYALACTVVEMLTGAPPFRRDDSMALMWAQIEAEPPRLTERRPDLPRAADEVIAVAMAKSPARRFPTCRDFAAALTAAFEQRAQARPGPPTALAARAQADSVPPDSVPAGPVPKDPVPRNSVPKDPAPMDPPPADRTAANREHAAQDPWADIAARDWFRSSGPAGAKPVPEAEETMGPGWRDNAAASANGPVPAGISPFHSTGRDARGSGRRPPAEAAWPGQAPPPRRDDLTPGTWSTEPTRGPAARGSRGSHRARNVTLTLLIAVVGLAGVAGIVYKLSHRQDRTRPPVTVTRTVPATSAANPARTVREYFAAINHRRYLIAWRLTDESETYATFKAGYAGTAHDTLKVLSTSGNVVTGRLVALQANGTVRTYQGTYTVTNGVISSTDVQRVS